MASVLKICASNHRNLLGNGMVFRSRFSRFSGGVLVPLLQRMGAKQYTYAFNRAYIYIYIIPDTTTLIDIMENMCVYVHNVYVYVCLYIYIYIGPSEVTYNKSISQDPWCSRARPRDKDLVPSCLRSKCRRGWSWFVFTYIDINGICWEPNGIPIYSSGIWWYLMGDLMGSTYYL